MNTQLKLDLPVAGGAVVATEAGSAAVIECGRLAEEGRSQRSDRRCVVDVVKSVPGRSGQGRVIPFTRIAGAQVAKTAPPTTASVPRGAETTIIPAAATTTAPRRSRVRPLSPPPCPAEPEIHGELRRAVAV